MRFSKSEVLQILSTIKDPEIHVLNIVELGIVQDIEFGEKNIQVFITPTYSGCPAKHSISESIIQTLNKQGFKNIDIKTVFSPPWTTDRLSLETKLKMNLALLLVNRFFIIIIACDLLNILNVFRLNFSSNP